MTSMRSLSRLLALGKRCSECGELWRQYAEKTTTYIAMLEREEDAGGTPGVLAALAGMAGELGLLREAIIRHESETHGRSCPLRGNAPPQEYWLRQAPLGERGRVCLLPAEQRG
jgi:hypothetical protein